MQRQPVVIRGNRVRHVPWLGFLEWTKQEKEWFSMDMVHCYMCMKTINSHMSYTKQESYSGFNERRIEHTKRT